MEALEVAKSKDFIVFQSILYIINILRTSPRMFSQSVIVVFIACLAITTAFKAGVRPTGLRLSKLNMKVEPQQALAAMAPFAVATNAFAQADAITTSMPLSLEVTFAAYLAVLLGTFVPVTFLIVLYSQTEARKAGARGQ